MCASAGRAMSGIEGNPAQLTAATASQRFGSIRRSARLRGLIAAGGVIGAIWLVIVSWRMAADFVTPWDSKNQFYAFFRFLASTIHSGSTPFWNPYHYGGHPSIADPQSLIFAPAFVLWAL